MSVPIRKLTYIAAKVALVSGFRAFLDSEAAKISEEAQLDLENPQPILTFAKNPFTTAILKKTE